MANGFEIVEEVNPAVGLQLYVVPEIALVPILNPEEFVTHVFVKSVPAFAIGDGNTVIVITVFNVHVVTTSGVKVYVCSPSTPVDMVAGDQVPFTAGKSFEFNGKISGIEF